MGSRTPSYQGEAEAFRRHVGVPGNPRILRASLPTDSDGAAQRATSPAGARLRPTESPCEAIRPTRGRPRQPGPRLTSARAWLERRLGTGVRPYQGTDRHREALLSGSSGVNVPALTPNNSPTRGAGGPIATRVHMHLDTTRSLPFVRTRPTPLKEGARTLHRPASSASPAAQTPLILCRGSAGR